MLNLLKWLSGTALTLVLLLAAAALFGPKIIDPNDYRQELTSLVADKTGIELELQGPLELSLFPWIGVQAQQLSISQPPSFGDDQDPVLRVADAQLRVKVWPLLSKRVEVDTVVLQRPQLHIITRADGSNSISELLPSNTQSDEKRVGNSDTAAPTSEAAVALVVQGLQISEGVLQWDDRESGTQFALNQIDFQIDRLLSGESVDWTVSAEILGMGSIRSESIRSESISFSATGQAQIDLEELKAEVRDLSATIAQGAQSSELKIQQLRIDANKKMYAENIQIAAQLQDAGTSKKGLSFSGQVDSLQFDPIKSQIQAFGSRAQGELPRETGAPIPLRFKVPTLVYQIQSDSIRLNELSIEGDWEQRPIELRSSSMRLDLEAQRLRSASLSLKSGDIAAEISEFAGSQIFSEPRVAGILKIPAFDASRLLRELEVEFEPSEVGSLQSLAINTAMNFEQGVLQLTKIDLQLDQSKLSGDFSISPTAAKPEVDFDLTVDRINVDHYLPVSSEDDQAEGSAAAALAVPMALLRDLDANGRFQAKQLVSGGVVLEQLDVLIESTPGHVRVTPKARLYEGTLSGSMEYSQEGSKSILKVDNRVESVNLSQFTQAADVNDQVTGTGTLALDITAVEDNGKLSQQGTVELQAIDGAVEGVDVESTLNQLLSLYQTYKQSRGRTPEVLIDKAEVTAVTQFKKLLGSFRLEGNTLVSEEFTVITPFFNIRGEGAIDLVSQTVNYRTDVSVLESEQLGDQKIPALFEKLRGLVIPIRYEGPLSAPNYRVDTSQLIKSLLQGEAKKELAEELGVETERRLSTKEIIQQAILNKITEKIAPQIEEEAPQAVDNNSEDSNSVDSSTQIENNPAVDSNKAASESTQSQSDSAQQELEQEELKKTLLEDLFN